MRMSTRGTVTINGQLYDAVTGLPVTAEAAAAALPTRTAPTQSTHLHAHTQRSTTLSRKFTQKPTPARTTITTHHTKAASAAAVHHAARPAAHPQVRRFAPHPVDAVKSMDIAPVAHPHVTKAHAASAAKAATPVKKQIAVSHVPAAEVKRSAIETAVAHAEHTPAKTHKTPFWQQKQRVTGIVAATFAIVLLGGYFTYLNMPSLSVRVAAAQAGINASYPDYRPDGYALNGPVTYSDGRVSMNFKANSNEANFTVSQSKSSWNSDAVLDNYVQPRAGQDYLPYTERGLTIYTYNNNAAWVNGGILYTIEGDAPLSSEQIRRIATSLL